MPLYIKDDKVANLARDLARKQHCTVTDLVRRALEREAREVEADEEALWRDIREIQQEFQRHWRGPLTSNHDFLYDENGDPIL